MQREVSRRTMLAAVLAGAASMTPSTAPRVRDLYAACGGVNPVSVTGVRDTIPPQRDTLC